MTDTVKVLVHAKSPEPLLEHLAKDHPTAMFASCETYEDLPSQLNSFKPDAVFSIRFAGTPTYPKSALLNSQHLKWLSVGGSGIDHLGMWDPNGLTVTNAAGVAADMMAEYALGAFLHFSLDVPGLQKDQSGSIWRPRKMTPLRGKTVLIVGLGSTGSAVARNAKAMGMKVIGTRARPKPVEHVDQVYARDALPTLWAKADYVVVSVPLLPSTAHLIDEDAFNAMKSDAVLVDVSRGGVVDQTALEQALRAGKIKGAALDVFETEPLPQESGLWHLPNVLISPHCSSVFEGWEMASIAQFSDNLKRWIGGQHLNNVVDPNLGY